MSIEEIKATISALNGEEVAMVIPKDAKQFPYNVCTVQKGYEDEDKGVVDNDRFYVICGDSHLPPNLVHFGGFATAEAVLDGCIIANRPLKDWIADLEIGNDFTV